MKPIDRLIDAACGIPPGWKPDTVTLRCPKCEREKVVARHETDLPGTAVVEALCPECDNGGNKETVSYLDSHGNSIRCAPALEGPR